MKPIKDQPILVVDPDAFFREELYNFLLSAGYERVDSASDFNNALEKLEKSAYDVLVSDAGSPFMEGVSFARNVSEIKPGIRVILMIRAEHQLEWTTKPRMTAEFHFLIKPTFPRSLLFLLEQLS